jgi:diguanylate cyclase (GGDEF)-like protein
MADVILVADDDPDILRFVELNLRLEGYEVYTAADGEEALEVAKERSPELVILDVMMPRMDGYEVCQRLRQDSRTSHMCIIMLTAKSMSADKVLGLTSGADDYISKPFDPMELVARVKTTLRRTREMTAMSPLTGLPGNIQIEAEMKRRVAAGEPCAVLWLDLDNFKAFNDRYGWVRGDTAITYLADVLREVSATREETWTGHIGGDDFVMVTAATAAEDLCEAIVKRFDRDVRDLYDPADAERGTVRITDRLGRELEYPLLSVSIGAATNEHRTVADHRELVETATEMKSFAKKRPGSVYSIDRRGTDGPS